MNVPVVIRTARQWAGYAAGNPFPDEAHAAPNRLLLLVSKRPPVAGAEAALEARGQDGERVGRVRDGLWISFPQGSGISKLSPSLIDRLVGSPATSRNYRTVMKLKEMLEP